MRVGSTGSRVRTMMGTNRGKVLFTQSRWGAYKVVVSVVIRVQGLRFGVEGWYQDGDLPSLHRGRVLKENIVC